LLPFFKIDKELCSRFFSNLRMLFYAGAGMPQHVWDEWEQLAIETTGEKVLIGTGLGCTETCPSALFASEPGGFAGLLGVPVPGMELKLVRVSDKLEARYRGRNIFPGYWRQPEITEKVFDDEGFYCTGDALKFVDENDPNKGMLFDGRLTEDFKLNTGTWVSVGNLRTLIIAAGKGLIQDVVITGHDKDFIGAIVFPGMDHCKKIMHEKSIPAPGEFTRHPLIRAQLQAMLNEMAKKSTGSASLVKRAIFAEFALSIDKGEVTDKGSINQRMIIQNHPEMINKLYAVEKNDGVFEVERKDIGY